MVSSSEWLVYFRFSPCLMISFCSSLTFWRYNTVCVSFVPHVPYFLLRSRLGVMMYSIRYPSRNSHCFIESIPTAKHSPNSTLRYLNCKLCTRRVTWCSVFDYYDFSLLEGSGQVLGGLFLWAFTMHRHSLASDDVMESESKRSRISFAPSRELLTSFQKMAFARRPPSIRLRCAETCGSLIIAHRHGHAA